MLLPSLRFVLGSFDVRMWRVLVWPRLILPVPVFEKRLAAPEWVFNLGIVFSFWLHCALNSAYSPRPLPNRLERTTLGTEISASQGGPDQYIAEWNLPPSGLLAVQIRRSFSSMPVLSVDLACRSWSDLGVVLLEQTRPPKAYQIHCEIIRWDDPAPPVVVELALRLNTLCLKHGVSVLMLDGPQAWKAEDNGHEHCRASERELNTSAKTGLPGTVLPGTYERFVGFCLALYEALDRLGWQRLGSRDQFQRTAANKRTESGGPVKILVESYPYAAWKSLKIPPLPSKRRCRVSNLAEAYAALTAMLPITTSRPPNHDQLQAIVGGLPGLALENSSVEVVQPDRMGTRIVGQPPRWEGGFWREGFIAVPVVPRPAAAGPIRNGLD